MIECKSLLETQYFVQLLAFSPRNTLKSYIPEMNQLQAKFYVGFAVVALMFKLYGSVS